MSDWHSESLDKIAPAMVKAQIALQPAIKESRNPAFKSKYADLNNCLEAINEAFHPQGLCVTQLACPVEGGFALRTVVLHESGQWLAGQLPFFPDMANPQKVGGCMTYGRRYGAAAATGLTQEDDDGETANGRGPGHDYERSPAPQGNGNGYHAGNGNGRAPQGNGNGNGGGYGPPKDGRSLFAWAKSAGEAAGVDVVKWLDAWGRRQNLPPKFADWPAPAITDGHAAAVKQLGKLAVEKHGPGEAYEEALTN